LKDVIIYGRIVMHVKNSIVLLTTL
jgi:hypothetical protein